MATDSNTKTKEQLVANALASGEARLVAIVIGRELALTAGEDGLSLPHGNYALVMLPETKAAAGVYAVRPEAVSHAEKVNG